MGNNNYNQTKDILTDIFDNLQDKAHDKLLKQNTDEIITSEQYYHMDRKISIICQVAKNHALNDFETTYKDSKIQLENL